MRLGGRYLAVDWGTTNRRTYRIEAGAVASSERDDRGVTSVDDFEAEVAELRAKHGDLPMLLAGMVGSNIGWKPAPYAEAPAGIAELVGKLAWIDDRTAIVPGIATASDVMRGEEVQLLGAVAAGLAPADSLLCQPGTHCKWAEMAGGRVTAFTTAMTGELFALLRAHGLLAKQLGSAVAIGDAFREGVEEGKRRDLAASLFGIRAAGVLGNRDDADAASYASGLLIGADVAARLSGWRPDMVHVLADPVLGGLYAEAIAAQGVRAELIDSRAAFAAGIVAIGNAIA